MSPLRLYSHISQVLLEGSLKTSQDAQSRRGHRFLCRGGTTQIQPKHVVRVLLDVRWR